MSFALVGNNDGPLRLLKSMQQIDESPIFVGLQNPVDLQLQEEYLKYIPKEQFSVGFDEYLLLELLSELKPTVLINCFCNFKFTKLLDHYTVLNLHLSPLPKYRGRHPMHWALIRGEEQYGISLHMMNKEYDAGAILWQSMIELTPGWSVAILREKLMQIVERDFGKIWQLYKNNKIEPIANKDRDATYAPKRNPQDSELTEWHDANIIYRKVMALRSEKHPAYLKCLDHKIPVTAAELVEDIENVEYPTPYISKFLDQGVLVVCHDKSKVKLLGFDPSHYSLQSTQSL